MLNLDPAPGLTTQRAAVDIVPTPIALPMLEKEDEQDGNKVLPQDEKEEIIFREDDQEQVVSTEDEEEEANVSNDTHHERLFDIGVYKGEHPRYPTLYASTISGSSG